MERLRTYQEEDVTFITGLNAAGIFNEPRTGKTPTSIIAMMRKLDPPYKFIVVAPVSMLYKWKAEIERWAGIPVVVVTGNKTKRLKIIKDWNSGALVINYEIIRDYTRLDDGVHIVYTGHYHDLLKQKPQGIILDEAHRIKSRTKKTPKAIFKLSKIPYKLALTGTPSPNVPEEVWAILHFLNPQQYRSYWNWVDSLFKVEQLPFSTYSRNIAHFLDGCELKFQKELDTFCTNRKRKEVMSWLPDKPVPIKIKLPATKLQAKYFEELSTMFETETLITQGVLDRVIRYRQIANAPELVKLKGSSPKINWVKAYIKEYPNTPTLYFTKFTQFAKLVAKAIKKENCIYVGETDVQVREGLINDFQCGKINTLILQTDAGKEGLTLDTAERIIFLDQIPPASDNLQASDRFIPINKKNSNVPKEIIHLMIADSYDEELYNLVEHRIGTTDIINSFKKYIEERRNQCQ